MHKQPVSLVLSQIVHVRHGTPSHKLERAGLSVWIDLDRLDEASKQSSLFSVNRFNLLSFHEKDFGCNHRSRRQSGRPVTTLSDYVRTLVADHYPEVEINDIYLLTFPRILGLAFNPISVYLCSLKGGTGTVIIYEVHNTFGDAHSYIALSENNATASLHKAEKKLHVSPFFSRDGHYHLRLRCRDNIVRLLIKYSTQSSARLTATLYGHITPLSSQSIMRSIWTQGQLPLRAWMAIHYEALKLWAKGCVYFSRPEPVETPVSVSKTSAQTVKGKKKDAFTV